MIPSPRTHSRTSRVARRRRCSRMRLTQNIVVFSATDSAAEAQEDANLGHGIFTTRLPRS